MLYHSIHSFYLLMVMHLILHWIASTFVKRIISSYLACHPHTTHALQPLDVSVFKSLKDHFAKAIRNLSCSKKIIIVTKREFSKILKSPFEHIPSIKAGFAKTGLYPINPEAVAKSKMTPSELYGNPMLSSSSSIESSGTYPPSSSYIPTSLPPEQAAKTNMVSVVRIQVFSVIHS